MPKSGPSKSGDRWTPADISKLKDLAGGNTPTRVIGLELGRTPSVMSSKAAEEHISLKPTNQSPYSRRTR